MNGKRVFDYQLLLGAVQAMETTFGTDEAIDDITSSKNVITAVEKRMMQVAKDLMSSDVSFFQIIFAVSLYHRPWYHPIQDSILSLILSVDLCVLWSLL